MALTMFTRFVSVQNVMNIGTTSALCTTINGAHRLNVVSRSYTSTINADQTNIEDTLGIFVKSNKKVSKQMRAYINRVQKHEEFMKKEIAEYEIGVRHLANMMGRDPEEMTVKRINKSIRYLFPSGLFERRAVPRMAHPTVIHPRTKDAAFDENGRPHHFMFYTGKPNYYEALHNLTVQSLKLVSQMERTTSSGQPITEEHKMNPIGTKWMSKKKLKKVFSETLSDDEYEYFISCLERLLNHPMSALASDYIMKYRDKIVKHSSHVKILELCDGEDGRKYVLVPETEASKCKPRVTDTETHQSSKKP